MSDNKPIEEEKEITDKIKEEIIEEEIEIDKSKMKDLEDEKSTSSNDEENGENNGESDDDDDESEGGDEAVITFMHDGSVFSVHWNQTDPNLVATGGEEEKAYVWNLTTKKKLFTIPEKGTLGESITIVKFSPNGAKVAVAALNGVVQVWDVAEKNKISDCEGCEGELSFLEWDSTSRGLFGGDENGLVYVWAASSGNCKVLSGHADAVTCGCFTPEGFFSSSFFLFSSFFILL